LPTGAVKPASPPPIPTGDELRQLVDRAQAGDASTVPTLRRLFDNPATVDVLGGDLAREAQSQLIRKFAGKNHLFAEAIPRKLELLRKELTGPNSSPLERLSVERIVSCWLHLHHLETTYGAAGSMSLDLATYYQRSIARAQKNYLAAIRALATIRKLALPALQVNIARKQVNVMNSPAGEREGTATAS
jgi:hypothetical protein